MNVIGICYSLPHLFVFSSFFTSFPRRLCHLLIFIWTVFYCLYYFHLAAFLLPPIAPHSIAFMNGCRGIYYCTISFVVVKAHWLTLWVNLEALICWSMSVRNSVYLILPTKESSSLVIFCHEILSVRLGLAIRHFLKVPLLWPKMKLWHNSRL